jgi:hypothetical protein
MNRDYLQATTVAKTLRAGAHGTKRAQAKFGDALVCVRYRHDAMRLQRLTTVELVIDASPLHPRAFNLAKFGLRIEPKAHDLHRSIRAAGGQWDGRTRLWWLKGSAIRKLGLVHCIVQL